MPPDRLSAITADPRHYGFHGTLKPPLTLAAGTTADDLLAAVEEFARRHRAFSLDAVELARLEGFIALVPGRPSPELDSLAAACVREFDRFRAPADSAEIAKRRAVGLTPRQNELLRQWGYPYVLDQFRFHLTLTGRLDEAVRGAVWPALARLTAPLCAAPVPVRDVAVFHQPDRASPFRVLARLPLSA